MKFFEKVGILSEHYTASEPRTHARLKSHSVHIGLKFITLRLRQCTVKLFIPACTYVFAVSGSV